MFTLNTVGNTGAISASQLASIESVTLAAANFWARYINFGNVSLDIELDFESLGNRVLANAGPVLFFSGFNNGNRVFTAGTLQETLTGNDPNGAQADIFVTINSDAILDGTFFVGDYSNGNFPDIPFNQIDLFSTIIHELGHGFGFLSFLDRDDNAITNFDLQVEDINGEYFFTGQNAVEVFGGNVPLTGGDPSHLDFGVGDILEPQITFGERGLPSPLNVAIFRDLGFETFAPTGGDDDLIGFFSRDNDNLQGGNDRFEALGGDDTVSGGAGNDTIEGDDGADILNGDGGFDTLIGGNGNDLLNGGSNADNLFGGNGSDTLRGGDGLDRLFGEAGNDELEGNAGNDGLFGDLGNDTLRGQSGDDRLFGGASFDTLYGGSGQDQLFGGSNADNLFGGNGNDVIFGEHGADRLFGELGNDTLNGGTFDDVIFAGAGFDVLNGGAGNDRLFGNFNWDIFVFENGFGNDVIGDFDQANAFERIDLSAVSNITNFSDLANNHLSQDGNGNAVITDGANTITLTGVSANALTAGDFIF
ncbi:MAG: hypothetical protein AAF199_06545 [Pseudomonadota bacterium]